MVQDKVREGFESVRDSLRRDEILAALGLEKKRTVLEALAPAVGLFLAGALVGSAVALLTTPKSGREMRRNLKGRATDLGHRIGNSAGEMAEAVLGSHSSGNGDAPVGAGESGHRRMDRPQPRPAGSPPEHK